MCTSASFLIAFESLDFQLPHDLKASSVLVGDNSTKLARRIDASLPMLHVYEGIPTEHRPISTSLQTHTHRVLPQEAILEDS